MAFGNEHGRGRIGPEEEQIHRRADRRVGWQAVEFLSRAIVVCGVFVVESSGVAFRWLGGLAIVVLDSGLGPKHLPQRGSWSGARKDPDFLGVGILADLGCGAA